MTVAASTVLRKLMPFLDPGRPYTEVRCFGCKRLLLKWQYSGLANIEVKCPRCGKIDLIGLSTN